MKIQYIHIAIQSRIRLRLPEKYKTSSYEKNMLEIQKKYSRNTILPSLAKLACITQSLTPTQIRRDTFLKAFIHLQFSCLEYALSSCLLFLQHSVPNIIKQTPSWKLSFIRNSLVLNMHHLLVCLFVCNTHIQTYSTRHLLESFHSFAIHLNIHRLLFCLIVCLFVCFLVCLHHSLPHRLDKTPS